MVFEPEPIDPLPPPPVIPPLPEPIIVEPLPPGVPVLGPAPLPVPGEPPELPEPPEPVEPIGGGDPIEQPIIGPPGGGEIGPPIAGD